MGNKINFMKEILIIALSGFLILSCSTSQNSENKIMKSAYEQENESLATGVRKDTLYLGVQIGNSYEEFQRQIEVLLNKQQIQVEADSNIISILQTKNYKYYTRSNFIFENGKVFRCVSHLYPEKSEKISDEDVDMRTDILTILDKTYKNERKQDGTQNSEYYWLTGNRRTDFYDTLGRYIVAHSDIQTERVIEDRIERETQKAVQKEKEEDNRIFSRLKEKAKRDWPNDYTTQEYWLSEQKEAYEYMKNIPDDNIKKKAQRDWPLDFSTQKYWYNEQIEARERLK